MHVVEADQVGKSTIAEKHRHSAPFIGVIEAAAIIPTQVDTRLSQNAFIRRHPFVSQRCRQQRDVIRDGSFRWPQALRRSAESFADELSRLLELFPSVVGEVNIDWNMSIDVTVDEQRKNRMIEGRRGNLDNSLIL